MGVLTTTSRSTRAERICNSSHQATDLLANATEQLTETNILLSCISFYGSRYVFLIFENGSLIQGLLLMIGIKKSIHEVCNI